MNRDFLLCRFIVKTYLTHSKMVRIIRHLLNGDETLRLRSRGIAQSGSAPALGAGCREFESLYPDQLC
jgi:hypothetical protein